MAKNVSIIYTWPRSHLLSNVIQSFKWDVGFFTQKIKYLFLFFFQYICNFRSTTNRLWISSGCDGSIHQVSPLKHSPLIRHLHPLKETKWPKENLMSRDIKWIKHIVHTATKSGMKAGFCGSMLATDQFHWTVILLSVKSLLRFVPHCLTIGCGKNKNKKRNC